MVWRRKSFQEHLLGLPKKDRIKSGLKLFSRIENLTVELETEISKTVFSLYACGIRTCDYDLDDKFSDQLFTQTFSLYE